MLPLEEKAYIIKVTEHFHTFLHFPTKVKSVYAYGLSVCPSASALTIVNILQIFLNWYMFIIFYIAWTVLKMEHVRQKFYLLRRTKFSETLKAMGRKFLKCISTYCTTCNEVNICHLDIRKNPMKNGFVYRFTQKFSNMLLPFSGNFSNVF